MRTPNAFGATARSRRETCSLDTDRMLTAVDSPRCWSEICRPRFVVLPSSGGARSTERGVAVSRGRGMKTVRGSLSGLPRFNLTIARRRIRDQGIEQFPRNTRHLVEGCIERNFVSPGWLAETAQLSHKLQRRGPNLLVGRRRLKVMQRFNISAHIFCPLPREQLCARKSKADGVPGQNGPKFLRK